VVRPKALPGPNGSGEESLRDGGAGDCLPAEGEWSMATREEIFEKVRATLVDALGVDEDEVTLQSRLAADLGAESIDFLDIVFRLEKAFNTKIPRGELFPENFAAADASLVADGVVTEKGIAELREKMPHADVDAFAKNPKVENIQELFTVNMIVNFLERKLAA
jgi:acyl carrier protein